MQLSPRISDFSILLFLAITLFFRFQLESKLGNRYMVSMFLGILPLAAIYVLMKWKVLNPTFFGLLNRKN